MKRIFFFLVLMAISLTFISCGDNSSINPGLYEIIFNQKYAGQAITIMQRVRYHPEGTYESINFENNKAVDEFKGRFKVEKNKIVFYDHQQRFFMNNGKWTQKEQSIMEIRKIKKGSYQYFLKYPDAQTGEKYKKIGLSEGWKTYKRISN